MFAFRPPPVPFAVLLEIIEPVTVTVFAFVDTPPPALLVASFLVIVALVISSVVSLASLSW